MCFLIASYSPNVIIDKLRNSFPDLYQRVEWSDFYLWENELDYYEYYNSHMDEIDAAVKLLSDEKSKTVFENLLQYKISRDRNLIKNIRDNVSEQYFTDEIMSFTDREIFMDLGAYTGDTIKGFITAVDGKYKKIIAIEPDEKNFSLLKKQTYNLPNIDCHQIGVSDREGNAKFAAKALYTSCFDETGEIEIKTRTVDSILNGDEITFIKADIEGLEQKMLIGAQEAIKTYKPKIAIAVYHKKEDIFYIINLLHIYRSDYKFYLRHYTEMPIDTVLYAV